MKKTLILLAFILCAGASAAAQTGEGRARRDSERGARPVAVSRRVVSVGPRTTYLKEGLSTEEVFKLLGRPAERSEREEDGATVVTYVFERGEGRVLVAEFVSGVLVRSRVEPRGEGLRAETVNF